jgi:hypothetical protein
MCAGEAMSDDIKYDETSPEVDGDWRVDHELCVACGAPPVQAPELMGFGDKFAGARAGDIQCYFKKQPSSRQDVERACVAAATSCCNAIRYYGHDQEIRSKMPDLVGPAPRSPWRSGVHSAATRQWLWAILGAAVLLGLWLVSL